MLTKHGAERTAPASFLALAPGWFYLTPSCEDSNPGPHQTSSAQVPSHIASEPKSASRGQRCVCWRCSLDGSEGRSGGSGLSTQLELETHSELGMGRGIPSRQTAHVP